MSCSLNQSATVSALCFVSRVTVTAAAVSFCGQGDVRVKALEFRIQAFELQGLDARPCNPVRTCRIRGFLLLKEIIPQHVLHLQLSGFGNREYRGIIL